ncbi:ribosome small subunit-dependent GTPase A [Oceanobacillus caeni]|uniref:ribosome small subunit-dependent GTPase A n=1 Tax=Oceanobacillus TaxID=182709 RepID=UPI0006223059|nr:ribosome small subunit-dependent GTPase A [Oceanobacillus caeni]KKE78328.1 GTPase RsgA [Bacilli bacterium VT-13-104]PZD84160.1 ribosome small subunit-dependent GTPase A [Bacilli bacterium]MBU8790139.1 ribosome small subunit-dependent GTPase A [Oceanobacillus caeni]MCR1833298.1 ribosome small subunit-dependent GTPase A [Oceanobacillus caeni]PZD91915.1 ribosome small subunit-dependent GTPase A [Bacilli bacterium]
MAEGRIIKALSGFYYVKSNDNLYQCRGRGVFRNKKITPLVGDMVEFEINGPNEGYIMEIKPRKNELVRPPIANINQAIIVSSAIAPEFSTKLLDRFLVLIEFKNIKPVIFITKIDLLSEEKLEELKKYKKVYENIGYQVELLSTKDSNYSPNIGLYLKNHITVIAGQSGVGKTSLINLLDSSLLLATGEISESLGRGKHTTRHVELLEVEGGLVADTPGFSALDFNEIELEELPELFPEMRERRSNCKFRGCLHHREPKCAIKEALSNGEIEEFRYEHYLDFLKEIQTRKPRY